MNKEQNPSCWDLSGLFRYLGKYWKLFLVVLLLSIGISVLLIRWITPKYESTCVLAPLMNFSEVDEPAYTDKGYKIPFEEQTQMMLEVLHSNDFRLLADQQIAVVAWDQIAFGRTANYQVFIKIRDTDAGKAAETANLLAAVYNQRANAINRQYQLSDSAIQAVPVGMVLDKAFPATQPSEPKILLVVFSVTFLSLLLTVLILLLCKPKKTVMIC